MVILLVLFCLSIILTEFFIARLLHHYRGTSKKRRGVGDKDGHRTLAVTSGRAQEETRS
jgi:hypothetical protein